MAEEGEGAEENTLNSIIMWAEIIIMLLETQLRRQAMSGN